MKTSALLGVPPARESLFNDRELVSKYKWLPEVAVALENAYARPRIPAWDVVEGIVACALDRALVRAAAVDRDIGSTVLAPDATPEAAASAALALDPEFVAIARDELARASLEIEGVMEEWGFYEAPGYYAENPDARISGDPRDEWDCEATS